MTFRTVPTYYQKDIYERSLNMPYAALFLEQGLGKSKIVIDTCCRLFLDGKLDGLLVISTKAVAENWYINEIPKHIWANVPHISRLWGRSNRSESELIQLSNQKNILRIYCINVEALRSDKCQALVIRLLASGRFTVVVDESTIIKNPSAAQSRRCLALAKHAAYTRILSGEPAPNGPIDLYHQYKFLSPHVLPGFTKDSFMLAFCQIETKWFGGRRQQNPGKDFTPHGQKMFEQMVGHCTFRLRKADVNKTVKFPAIKEHSVPIFMYQEQSDLYRQVLENVKTELHGILGEVGTIRTDVIVSRLVKLHQITSGFVVTDDKQRHYLEHNPKLDALVEVMENHRQGKATLIWCHYRADVDQVAAALSAIAPGQVGRIYGGIPDHERLTTLEKFMRGEILWLVANPHSIGHGLTLTPADTAIYYSNHWNYEHKVQSRDRIHRLGQTAETCYYLDLIMQDSIDEEIVSALQGKRRFCESLFQSEWIQRCLDITPQDITGPELDLLLPEE